MNISFTNTVSFNTGSTILEGSTCFDSYKSENTLKFFTIGSIDNAVLTLNMSGLTEGTDFTRID